MNKKVSWTMGWRAAARGVAAGALLALPLAASVAQAQTGGATPPPKSDSSLTWNGITLYGIVDIGLQYQTHGVPISDYFPAGTESPIQKNSNGSVTAVTPNNLSQSRIGLSGVEPLMEGWSAVFRLETFFNPQSGNLSDALKSQVLNNGRALAVQSTNVDSSVAGQLFAGAAYAGFSSPTYGTLTFGRHVTPLADGIAKYDPMGAAQAFSLIGFSGTAGGGGDTEDRRLDQSLKYSAKFDNIHVGGLYQFSGSSGSTNTALQLTLGADFAGLSVDAYYAKKYNAVATSPLSAAQVSGLAAMCAASVAPPPNANGAQCYSPSNSLAATISDNTTYAIMGSYNLGGPTLYAAYEHIKFDNPSNRYIPGTLTIGGYVLAYVTNTAYDVNKTLKVFWAGVKWPVTPKVDVLVSYDGYKQDAFATGADAGCSSKISSKCSGTENTAGAVLDYKFTKRFDTYIGTFWSSVNDGLANGYVFNTSTLTTTAGVRFKF